MSVSLALVLAIQARVPDECQLTRHSTCSPKAMADFTHAGDAEAVRQAVAELAPDLDAAIEGIIFAAYESANRLDASGDGGKSTGACKSSSAPRSPITRGTR